MGKSPPLSEQIRAAVVESELTPAEICRAIRLDQGAMSRFLSGRRGLSLEVLDRLGRLLDLRLRPAKRHAAGRTRGGR